MKQFIIFLSSFLLLFLILSTYSLKAQSPSISFTVDFNYSPPIGKSFITYKNIYENNSSYDYESKIFKICNFGQSLGNSYVTVTVDLITGRPIIFFRTSNDGWFAYKPHGTALGDFRKKINNGSIDVNFSCYMYQSYTVIKNNFTNKRETIFLGLGKYGYPPYKAPKNKIITGHFDLVNKLKYPGNSEKLNKLIISFNLGDVWKQWDIVKSFKNNSSSLQMNNSNTLEANTDYYVPRESDIENISINQSVANFIVGSQVDLENPFDDTNIAFSSNAATPQNLNNGKQFIDRGNDGVNEFDNYDNIVPYNGYYILNKVSGKFLSTDSGLIINTTNKLSVPLSPLTSKFIQVHCITPNEEEVYDEDNVDSSYTIQPKPTDDRDIIVGFTHSPQEAYQTLDYSIQPRLITENPIDKQKSLYAFSPNNNGTYTITNNFSKKHLQSSPLSSYTQTAETKSSRSEWYLIPALSACVNNGKYFLINKFNGQYLQYNSDINSIATTETFTGASNQQFEIAFAGDGFFNINLENNTANLSLGTISGGRTVTQNTDTTGHAENQQFLIVPVDSGYFKLMTKNADKELGVIKVGTTTNYEVGEVGYSASNTTNQWQLIRIDEEEYNNTPVIVEYDTMALNTSTLASAKLVNIEEKNVLDNSFNKSSVFPNPTTGKFTIFLSPIEEQSIITVLNSQGKIVANSIATGVQRVLDISNQASGIYYVQVSNKTGVARIIKILKK